jgi:hypothetical protein
MLIEIYMNYPFIFLFNLLYIFINKLTVEST